MSEILTTGQEKSPSGCKLQSKLQTRVSLYFLCSRPLAKRSKVGMGTSPMTVTQ